MRTTGDRAEEHAHLRKKSRELRADIAELRGNWAVREEEPRLRPMGRCAPCPKEGLDLKLC
jgi:hypothetical protein